MAFSFWRWQERKILFNLIICILLLYIFYTVLFPTTSSLSQLDLAVLKKTVKQEERAAHSGISSGSKTPKDTNTLPESYDTYIGMKDVDPRLVDYIRTYEMVPPSRQAYNLTNFNKVHYSQNAQSQFAENNFLRGLGGGFFIEVGAFNGESMSNSLYFERFRGWTGLLIEPDPILYDGIISRNRKAYSIRSGLAFEPKAGITKYKANPKYGIGRIKLQGEGLQSIKTIPLYTMLLALNVTQIDFFSLDIEGDEMKVLQTIPWDKIRVRLFCIEINHVPGGVKGIRNFLEPLGYTFLGVKLIDAWFGIRELLEETMNVDEYLETLKSNK